MNGSLIVLAVPYAARALGVDAGDTMLAIHTKALQLQWFLPGRDPCRRNGTGRGRPRRLPARGPADIVKQFTGQHGALTGEIEAVRRVAAPRTQSAGCLSVHHDANLSCRSKARQRLPARAGTTSRRDPFGKNCAIGDRRSDGATPAAESQAGRSISSSGVGTCANRRHSRSSRGASGAVPCCTRREWGDLYQRGKSPRLRPS